MDVRLAAVAPDFEVVAAREPFRPTSEQALEIERVWRAELERRGEHLHDAPILAFVSSDRRRLVGRFVRYRDVIAGRREPAIFDGRPPAPVGVSGMVTARGRVVLGRRAEHVSAWPGRWELVPSGGLDDAFHDATTGRVDFVAQLLAELAEETPLPRPARTAARPFALAHDELGGSWNLCVALDLELGQELLDRLEQGSTPEYDAFRMARPVDVIEAGLWDGDQMVPLSWALVRLPRAA